MKNIKHKKFIFLIISCVVQSIISKKTNRCFSKHEDHELFIMIMTSMFEHVIVDVNFVRARSFSTYLSRWTTSLDLRYTLFVSRFQTRDLLVRFVSTRYESRHWSILRLRLSIYTFQHVFSHSIVSILVHSTHINICFLFMLMLWRNISYLFEIDWHLVS